MVYRNILLCRVFSFLRSKLERKIDCYTLDGDQILRKPPELYSILIEKYVSLLKQFRISYILDLFKFRKKYICTPSIKSIIREQHR